MENTERENIEREGAKIIAGRQPVIEALKSHSTMIEKIYILYGIRGSQIDKIKNLARKKGILFVEINKQKFRELASDTTTQGVIAVISETKYVTVDDILKVAKERNEPPFILALDEIVDPQNLGALVRTAECAGVHGVITTKHHSAIINSTVAKASAGAVAHIGISKVVNLAQTLERLKTKGIWIVGTDPKAPRYYYEIDYTQPIAIVIGNEGRGLRFLTKQKCDFLVKIPMYGKVESLNASVAGALMMYEVVRARELKRKQEQLEKEGEEFTNSNDESSTKKKRRTRKQKKET
jgi:23S rRNA (guanosine2251-2'-O)-methyltransferase